MPSDEHLVSEFEEHGDTRLLDELVRRHVGKVRAMIYQMVLNNADAEDLTQEVFTRAFRSLASFKKKARFSTWLYRIAMNTTYSFLSRRAKFPVSEPGDFIKDCESMMVSPEKTVVNQELDAEISSALSALPHKLRAAIVLTVIQGMSTREAARVEGCTSATIYWRIHAARKILRQRLEKYL